MKNNAREVFNYKAGRRRTVYPKATELAVSRIFGKINLNKVYIVEPDILKIAIFLCGGVRGAVPYHIASA